MLNKWVVFLMGVTLLFLGCSDPITQKSASFFKIESINDFLLRDSQGQSFSLESYGETKFFVFVSHLRGCPITRRMYPRLLQMSSLFSNQGVVFRYINSSELDSSEDLEKESEQYNVGLPILMDKSQQISKMLGFLSSNEVVVVDPKTKSIIYRGAIDDSQDYSGPKDSSVKNYLQEAIEAALRQKPVASSPPHVLKGCALTYREIGVELKGGPIPEMVLLDNQFSSFDFERFLWADKLILVSLDAGCPRRSEVVQAIEEMANEFHSEKEIVFRYLNVSLNKGVEEFVTPGTLGKLQIPILDDPGFQMVKSIGFEKSYEVAVVDISERKVVFKGEIRSLPHYLASSLSIVRNPLLWLNLKTIGRRHPLEIASCPIDFLPSAPIDFASVKIILDKKCNTCHDNLAQPHFNDYASVRGWSQMIKKSILIQQMPPTKYRVTPDSPLRVYPQDLERHEIQTVVKWVDQLSTAGKANTSSSVLVPHKPPMAKKTFQLKLSGNETMISREYEDFIVFQDPRPLDRDVIFSEFSVRGVSEDIQHLIIYNLEKPFDQYKTLEEMDLARLDLVYSSSFDENQSIKLASNLVHKFKKGSYLVFRIYFRDSSFVRVPSLELSFFRARDVTLPMKILKTGVFRRRDFQLKPGEVKTLRRKRVMSQDLEIVSFLPHMHTRGQDFKLYLRRKGQKQDQLLFYIPYYNMKQGSFLNLREPLKIRKGDALVIEGTYSNTPYQASNPNPNEWVFGGNRLKDDEAFAIRFEYY